MGKFIGTNGDDKLYGTASADFIDGGIGADTMTGYGGNDVYVVDNAGDQVIESIGGKAGGVDLVKSSVSFALGSNVENLILAGTQDIDGTGNDLNNTIVGNDGTNILDGGLGKDTLVGGKGDDIYWVDNAGDKVVETVANAKGGGHDAVVSTISFSLAKLGNVEDLYLTGGAFVDATGNAMNNALYGNDGGNHLNGGKGADFMAGGKGDDTYYVDNAGDVVSDISGNDTIITTIALGQVVAGVENYTFVTNKAVVFSGDGADNAIIAGAGADHLDGGAGNDFLNGGAGADVLTGGDGNDVYVVDNVKDQVSEVSNPGSIDFVLSTISINNLWSYVEGAELFGAGKLNLTGNDIGNTLIGNAGANVIDGGLGGDQMSGGKGNDTYIVDNAGDTVTEQAGEGIDLVKSGVTFQLGANIESLVLTGSNAIDGYGNNLNNVIVGNDGNNVLDGRQGADTLIGGKGSDFYLIDSIGDKVIETVANANGGGNDTVESSISFSLAKLGNVENLYLIAGAGDISSTGNALNNIMGGNEGNNHIDGGKGADHMFGGKGDDVYYIDNLADGVAENPLEGNDTVISTVAFSTRIDYVENYVFNTAAAVHFTGDAGTNSIVGGSGNDVIDGGGGQDYLYGNGGNDTLKGSGLHDILDGGTGADLMIGGDGDDFYFVDNAGDQVQETKTGGTGDVVYAMVSIAHLADYVETLYFQGKGNFNGTGNELDNSIMGNGGANKLDGGDGADVIRGNGGNDTLTGGSDADTFEFNVVATNSGNDGHDTITDFVKAEDVLRFACNDVNQDLQITLDDLLASVTKVVDHGAGKAVDVYFQNGAEITFAHSGTADHHIAQLTDLANPANIQTV